LEICQSIFYRFGFLSVELLFVTHDEVEVAIIETCKKYAADFIVMGCRGSNADETNYGSVCQYVLNNSPVTVLLTDDKYISPNESSDIKVSGTYRVPNWGPVLSKTKHGQVGKLTSHDFSLEETSKVYGLANKIKNNIPAHKTEKDAAETIIECKRCFRERKMRKFHKLADPNIIKLSAVMRGENKTATEKEAPHPPQGLEEISTNLSAPYPLFAVPSTLGCHSEFKHFLMRIPISTMFSPNELVIVDTKTTMADCLAILSKHWIQHALVKNSKGKIIGFVSVNDIFNYWMVHYFLSSEELNLTEIEQSRIGNLKNDKGVMDGVWMPLCEHDSVYKLMNAFANGCSITPITNMKGQLLSVVTQSDLVHFLDKNKEELIPAALLNSTVKENYLITNTVNFASNTPTWNVLKYLTQKHLTVAPIVDRSTGALVSALSINQTKGLQLDNLYLLCHDVTSFVELLNPHHWKGFTFTNDNCTIGEVLTLISDAPSHHLYITSPDGLYEGVIFMKDLIAVILTSFAAASH